MNYPKKIVLDTTAAVRKFRQRSIQLFGQEELREGFVEDHVGDLIGCLMYIDNARDAFIHYIHTQVRAGLIKGLPDTKIDLFEQALLDLARELQEILVQMEMYLSAGYFPYLFSSLVGDDVVLEFAAPEPDDDD